MGRASRRPGSQPLSFVEAKGPSPSRIWAPAERREREARARGWSILSSNWLVAPPFITGKEGRPGTRGGRELFHCSFPRAEEPAARPGSTPWGTRNVCAYWGRG